MFSGLMATVALCREHSYESPVRPLKGDVRAPTRFTRRIRSIRSITSTHSDHALLPSDREDGVVAPGPPCCGIDEEVDLLIRNWGRRGLSKHDVQVDRAEDLLERVEGQPTQFTFDEVWPVLHDSLKLDVSVPALPSWDKVEHVGTLSSLAVLSAGVAGESDGERGEEREVGGLVSHAQEPSEEVDLTCDSGDGQEACGPHYEEGEYCLVGEVGVDVGRLA
jgi:hypothetical protein